MLIKPYYGYYRSVGFIWFFIAAITPFVKAIQAKEMFINVYEDRVCGAYAQIERRVTRVFPYELTFDKIESVSAKKTDVFIQTAENVLQSKAYNAEEIVREITSRLPR